MLLRQIAVVIVAAVLAVPTVAAAQSSDDEDQCTSEVQILWSGVTFEPAEVPADESGWVVQSLETVSVGSGCAGLVQTLVLLDDAGGVLHRDSVVLDSQGDGSYSGIDVRVEEVTEVQVLLDRPPPIDPPDPDPPDPDPDLDDSDAAGPIRGPVGPPPDPIGPIPATGADLAVLVLLGGVLVVAGFALRRRIGRA